MKEVGCFVEEDLECCLKVTRLLITEECLSFELLNYHSIQIFRSILVFVLLALFVSFLIFW